MKKTLLIALVAFMITGCASKTVKEGSEEIGIIIPNTEVAEDKDTDTNEVSVEEDSKGSEVNPEEVKQEEVKQEDKPSSGQTASSGNSAKPTENKPSTKPSTGSNATTSKPSTDGTTTTTKPNTNTDSGSTTSKPAETKPSTGGSTTTTKPAETKPAETIPTTPSAPTPSTPNTPDGKKILSRVLERKIDLAVKKIPNENMNVGEEKVITEGKPRESWRIHYEVWENGQIILIGSEIESIAGVAKVIEYGTKITYPDPYYMGQSHNAAILDLVNAQRAKNGITTMQYGGSGLQTEANRRAKIISEQWRSTGTISHAGAMESENIQCGSNTPEAISRQYNNSPPHESARNQVSGWRYYATATYVDKYGFGCNVEVFSPVNK